MPDQPPLPPSFGDLTLRQLFSGRGVNFHWPITTDDVIKAWNSLSSYLQAQFPIINELVQALNELNTVYKEAQEVYLEATKLYNTVLKDFNAIVQAVTGNPASAQQAAKTAQQTALQAARNAVDSAVSSVVSKILDTPIKDVFPGFG